MSISKSRSDETYKMSITTKSKDFEIRFSQNLIEHRTKTRYLFYLTNVITWMAACCSKPICTFQH